MGPHARPHHPDNPVKTPSSADPPLVIGLLGGIAAGKSFVAGIFAEHGLRVVDADAEARAVVTEPAILAAITARFGPGVVTDGGLDRAALAATVFADPVARKDLEAITHPPVRARIGAAVAAARAAGRSVVLDVPLLLEGGLIDCCDECVFVEVPREVRLARAAARGWTPDELDRREAAQAPLADKAARCRFTVDNDGDAATTRAQVAAILTTLRGS